MNNSSSSYSNYRWVMFILGMFAALIEMMMWLSPAPLLTTIMQDLRIDYGAAGMLLTIISLMFALFIFGGSYIIDRLGCKNTMVIALFVLGAGGLLSFFGQSYRIILIGRLIVGIGYGLAAPVMGALVMAWFPPKEQPYINTVVNALAFVGITLAYLIVVPILKVVNTWQNTLAALGAVTVAVAMLWVIFGKREPAVAVHSRQSGSEVSPNQAPVKKECGLVQAAKRKEIWCLTVAMVGVLWTFSAFTAFLPAFFEKVRGYDLATASNLTGFLPTVGIIAGMGCGVATGTLGLRKPFLWPLMVLILIGAIGSITIPSGPLLYVSIGLVGLGAAGWAPVFMTVPMEIESATPEMVGGAFAIVLGIGYFVSYFVPIVFGALVPEWGMQKTMLTFSLSMILSIIALLMIPETGPRSKRKLAGPGAPEDRAAF